MIEIIRHRIDKSTWPVLTLLLLTILTALYIHYLRPKVTQMPLPAQISGPIQEDLILQSPYIKITNRSGTILLRNTYTKNQERSFLEKVEPKFQISKEEEKEENQNIYQWEIVSPRQLRAKSQTITHLNHLLNSLNVQKELYVDLVNLENFSLKNPRGILRFYNHPKENPFFTIELGLNNLNVPFSYIHIPGLNKIYKMDQSIQYLATAKLSDFIESQLFFFQEEEIENIKLTKYFYNYRGKLSRKKQTILRRSSLGEWRERGEKKRNSRFYETRKENLKEIFNCKAYMILDQITDPQLAKNVDKEKLKPLYQLMIKLKGNDKEKEILFSHPLKDTQGLKIAKSSYIFVWQKGENYPFIVNRAVADKLKITSVR